MAHTVRLEVSVTDFGAVGDGVTDDTQAIANALAIGDVVRFPNPPSYYKVTDDAGLLPLQLRSGQTIIGPGKWNECIQGDGSDIILKGGTIGGTLIDHVTILDLNISNTDYSCLQLYNSRTFNVQRCQFDSTNCDTVDIEYSWRAVFRDNRVATNGSGAWAIRVMNTMDGVVLDSNNVTGSTTGNCIDIGEATGATLRCNTFESTLVGYGIRVGGNDADSGVSSGVLIEGNYFESIAKPISIGETYFVYGASVASNRITTEALDPDDVSYGINLARVQCSTIKNNFFIGCETVKVTVSAVDDTATYTVTLNGTDFDYPAVGGDLEADILAGLQAVVDASGSYTATVVSSTLEIELDASPVQNFSSAVSATAAGGLSLSHPPFLYLDNSSNSADDLVYNEIVYNYVANQQAQYDIDTVTWKTFGYNRIQFDDGEEMTGLTREWISDTIDPSVGTASGICIVPQNGKGGLIDMIEIIEATGTLGCTVRVGYSGDTDENTGVDPSTLSYTNGRAECPVNVIWRIRSTSDLLYEVVSGAGTGSFRIRVRYRI